jgi:indole-3-glycerol phosphate synthase/phosphoribosylanthranilate isomerase
VRQGADLSWVGVFADQTPEAVAAEARALDLRAVQLHGEELPETVARVRALLPKGCEVWKAVAVGQRIPLRKDTAADRVLLDTPAPSTTRTRTGSAARVARGGTGRSFDWSLLQGYAERNEVVLAGGLRAENVAGAAALGTFALDASSGVESAPGVKDPNRLAAFFTARRRLPGRSAETR